MKELGLVDSGGSLTHGVQERTSNLSLEDKMKTGINKLKTGTSTFFDDIIGAGKSMLPNATLKNKGNTGNSIKDISVSTSRPANVDINGATKKMAAFCAPKIPEVKEKENNNTMVIAPQTSTPGRQLTLDNTKFDDIASAMIGGFHY